MHFNPVRLDLVVKPAVLNTYKRCRSRKCIRGHIPMHAILAVFIYFFIPVLSRPSFTSRTPNKNQKIEQLFYCPMVQIPSPRDIHELRGEHFCACYSQALTKVPRARSGSFWFAWTDSHDSTALVLLYNMSLEPSFSIKRFLSYMQLNIGAKITFQCMNLVDKVVIDFYNDNTVAL